MEKSMVWNLLVHIGLVVFIYFNVVTSQSDAPGIQLVRYEDKAFPSRLNIYKKEIQCSDDYRKGQYRTHTYTCKDMRVDGLRLAYGYHPSIIKNDNCNETLGFDENAEICRSMMRAIGSKERLWVAAVSNATCDFITENRLLLNMTKEGGYRWDEMKPGYGWVHTLQCMALKEEL